MAESKRYILLPRKGLLHEALGELHPGEAKGLVESKKPHLPFTVQSKLAGGRDIRVIHSIIANGPKLVELDDLVAGELDRNPDVCKFPVIEHVRSLRNRKPSGHSPAILRANFPNLPPTPRKPLKKSRTLEVVIRVMEKKGGEWVSTGSGLMVTAFYSGDYGDEGFTDDDGKVRLNISGDTIERLYCPQVWGWGAFIRNISVKKSFDLKLEPVSDNFTDCVRRYYGQSRFNLATGVTVGVIDSGVGPHDDINVIGGCNTTEDPDEDYQDDVDFPHGTFVAGLIGYKGKNPNLRGIAPGVQIQSYKVFGRLPEGQTRTYALVQAVQRAEMDQCDILNMSIEDLKNDDALEFAINDAREHGMLVVASAGNDKRGSVNYPAACPGVIGVSAMGCEGTFPSGVIDEINVSRPPASPDNPKEFIAAFSNIGDQISVTALGVGVLSTLPDDDFGIGSGTSFSAPIVTGAAASFLSQAPDIYNMPRNRARSDEIEKLLLKKCISRGFKREYQGRGMPDPAQV